VKSEPQSPVKRERVSPEKYVKQEPDSDDDEDDVPLVRNANLSNPLLSFLMVIYFLSESNLESTAIAPNTSVSLCM